MKVVELNWCYAMSFDITFRSKGNGCFACKVWPTQLSQKRVNFMIFYWSCWIFEFFFIVKIFEYFLRLKKFEHIQFKYEGFFRYFSMTEMDEFLTIYSSFFWETSDVYSLILLTQMICVVLHMTCSVFQMDMVSMDY